MKKALIWIIGVVGLLGMGFVGFREYQANKKIDQVVVPVKVALKWLHQAQFAGNYVALEKGYYRDSGMEVTLVPYDLKTSAIEMVASGSAMFGVAGADEVLLARSKGAPVVAVAVVYQESPVVAYALKSSGIQTVRDFKGKKVGYENSGNVAMTIDNMIYKGGLDPRSDVTRVSIGHDATSLIKGEVDVATGYMTNEPLLAIEAGYEINYIHPSQYGIMDYSDVLFASEKTITEQPEMVRGYVEATMKGWQVALADQELAVEAVMLYMDDKNSLARQHQQNMLAASESLIRPKDSTRLGEMTYIRWGRLYEEMKKANLITSSIDVKSAYSQEFLEK